MSRTWQVVSRDNALWRHLFIKNGWSLSPKFSQLKTRPNSLLSAFMPGELAEIQERMRTSLPRHQADVISAMDALELTDGIQTGSLSRDLVMDELVSPFESTSSLSRYQIERLNSLLRTPRTSDSNPSSSETVREEIELDWKFLYIQRYFLQRRWMKKLFRCWTMAGHTEAVYALQFDEKKVISGSRDGNTSDL